MAGNVPNYLKSLVGPETGFQFDEDPESSAFTKTGYYTSTPHIDCRYLIKPQTAMNDYGNQIAVIRVEKDHDFAGLSELVIPFKPISSTGTYTYLRRSDWLGFAVIKEIHIKHNTHTLQSWQGDIMFPHYILESTQESRSHWDHQILGGLSTVQREQLASASCVARVPLELFAFWSKNTHHYMNTQSFSDEIKIYVHFHDKSEWVQTDSNGTVTAEIGTVSINGEIFDVGLYLQQHHVTEAERVFHHQKQLNVGTLEPFVDYVNVGHAAVNPLQSNFFQVELKNLNMPVRHLCFVIRRANDLTTAYRKNHFRFYKILGFGMTAQASGGEFVPYTSAKYARARIHDQYHSSHADNRYPIYFWSWTFTPEDHINELGCLHFGNINSPFLNVYIGTTDYTSEARDLSQGKYPGSTGAESLVVDVFAQAFNMKQDFGGTPRKIFG